IHEEVAREVNRFLGLVFAQRHKDGRTDREAVESALRAALHQAGAAALAELLKFEAPAAEQRRLPCPCGHHAQYQELRSKPVVTIVGPASVSRPYFLCAQCGVGQFPVDVELDIENTEFSPGVRRMHALVGQEAPFDRPGKTEGKPAHTREVQLGCVFTKTTWDQEGSAIRDPDSTTYTGAIEDAEEFGRRIYAEACGRGWSRALQKVVIGDGAEWIWNLVALHFSDAIQIVDLYHARQHLWEVARKLYPNDQGKQRAWMKIHQKRLLDRGKIEKLVGALRSIESDNPEVAEKIRTEADYFERNAERMRYPKFRGQHLFVGSGVIEAGCKTVVASRLKRSGLFWTVRGAN